jgi:hypothetical protein
MHLGAIYYLVQQGYMVLDFDYRGSAGFGRDYRTDIYRSMGMKDIDGAVTAVEYLREHHGIDASRVGIYGISYGGFATLRQRSFSRCGAGGTKAHRAREGLRSNVLPGGTTHDPDRSESLRLHEASYGFFREVFATALKPR